MSEAFIGEIRMMSFTFAPRGWAPCNGQLLPINQNQALFSLLGTTYGGNGTTTFALPDLRGVVPMGTSGDYPGGTRVGNAQVTLLASQMPAHTHMMLATGDGVTSDDPNGNTLGLAADAGYGANANGGTLGTSTFAPAGGSQPHNNMQPSLTVAFCIALVGIYPSRS